MDGNLKIRTLRPEEIELKSQSVKQNGAVFALYKDSRVDMNILDEAFGTLGWKNTHEVIDGKTFCTISIWDPEKKEWVTKSNVGSLDSNNGAGTSVKVKGEISDSFKRAATVVGIGRELYTAPFVWIGSDKIEIKANNKGGFFCNTPIRVSEIEYDENRRICLLKIVKERDGQLVYSFRRKPQQQTNAPQNDKQALPQQSVQQNAAQVQQPVAQNQKAPANANPPASKPSASQPNTAGNDQQPQPPKSNSEGKIKVTTANNNQQSVGDFVIPVGYAKGKTLSTYWQACCKKKADKNEAINKDEIFAWFLSLSSPEYDQFKKAVTAFKAMLK